MVLHFLMLAPLDLDAFLFCHQVAVTSDSTVYQWGASPTTLCDVVREHRLVGRSRATPSHTTLGAQHHYMTPATVDTYNVVAKVVKVSLQLVGVLSC